MLVKHLITGTVVGIFALALGFDPGVVEQGASASDQPAAATDKGAAKGSGKERDANDKKAERSPKDGATVTASNKDGEHKDQDKPADSGWARRLVFPSGSKF
jgi:hypothetical protein